MTFIYLNVLYKEYEAFPMYKNAQFLNPKLSMIQNAPRTTVFGLWMVYCIADQIFWGVQSNSKLG